jgi:hypothetical protein
MKKVILSEWFEGFYTKEDCVDFQASPEDITSKDSFEKDCIEITDEEYSQLSLLHDRILEANQDEYFFKQKLLRKYEKKQNSI